jgi:hypothetical protein
MAGVVSPCKSLDDLELGDIRTTGNEDRTANAGIFALELRRGSRVSC